ncbi:MAG: hypothetical protein Q8Q87_01515, partial [Candidatus Omnitrophota bacterium]|nr:hypothetical protein [Candidatus Omnitrophota bacterium]
MLKHLAVFIIALALSLTASLASAKAPDIIKVNADLEVTKDMVVNDVVAIGGDVVISGKVENNIIAVGSTCFLRPNSIVGGQVVVIGGDIIKDPSSVIGGRITQIDMPRFIPSLANFLKGGWLAVWAAISILVFLGFLGLAILLVALIPEHIGATVNALERSFVGMALWGMAGAVLIVPIAILLAISIVGIILIPLEILLVVLALIIGYVASAMFIGRLILSRAKFQAPPFVDAAAGISILFLIGFVPVIGPLVQVLFSTAGFGAVITTR